MPSGKEEIEFILVGGGNHSFKNIPNTTHFFNSKLLKVSRLQLNQRFFDRPFHPFFLVQ